MTQRAAWIKQTIAAAMPTDGSRARTGGAEPMEF